MSKFEEFVDDGPLPGDTEARNELRYARRFEKTVEFNGVTKSISDWANDLGYSPHTMVHRLKDLDIADAMVPNQGHAIGGKLGAQKSPWRLDSAIAAGDVPASGN